MKARILLCLIFILGSNIKSLYAQSSSLALMGGFGSGSRVSGCCRPLESSWLGGANLRRENFIKNVDLEVQGISNGKWTSLSAGWSPSLLGKVPEISPEFAGATLTTVDQWNMIGSVGTGVSIHSTRTLEFDLPAQVVSVLLYARARIQYAIQDRYFIHLSPEFSLSMAQNSFTSSGLILIGVGSHLSF